MSRLIRSAYDERERLGKSFVDENGEILPSRTKQSFKAECDIQNILRKFQRTGVIEHARRFSGEFGHAPAVDFKTAMDIVAAGKSKWEELPTTLKQRFGSAESFLEFFQDEANRSEAEKLGLVEKRSPAEPEAELEPSPGPASAGSESGQ